MSAAEIRLLFGGRALCYGGQPLATRRTRARHRLRLELDALRRLPDRWHGLPWHLTDATGTVLYSVLRERGVWALRPTDGWRSYRLLARPVATADIPLTGAAYADERAAVQWAAELLGVEAP